MSLKIEIIGKGCYFCDQLAKIVEAVVAELGIQDAEIEHVEGVDRLLDYGVVNPPALVVGGKLKLMGRVLVRSRVRRAIEEELQGAAPEKDAGYEA